MCAIKPKHQQHFTLSVYTSLEMSKAEFIALVLEKAFDIELKLNSDTRLRWHISDTKKPQKRLEKTLFRA